MASKIQQKSSSSTAQPIQAPIPVTSEWASAKDAKTGRVYYYNTRTKETSWNKPIELASPKERAEMLRKRAETMEFFKEMEQNIKVKATQNDANHNSVRSIVPSLNRANSSEYSRPSSTQRYFRTISSIDDDILTSLKRLQADDPDDKSFYSSSPEKSDLMSLGLTRMVKIEARQKNTVNKSNLMNPAIKQPLSPESSSNITYEVHPVKFTPNGIKRRNSTGTIYIGTTMSVQDNDATINCVCVVIRTHMLDAAKENIEPLPMYDVFKDPVLVASTGKNDSQKVPSLSTVKDFFNLIFKKSQLENECIIIALIYCERLVKETKGKLCIRYDNWKSILFACLVMASKVWDDLSMWNVDFSQVSNSFDLQRINALELAILGELKYAIRVSASEYAKYYFHLRSMMARLGFHAHESSLLEPLNLSQARRLQLATDKYATNTEEGGGRPRGKTLDDIESNNHRLKRLHGDGAQTSTAPLVHNKLHDMHALVGLEQLIHSQHMDADGLEHMSRKNTMYVEEPSTFKANNGSANNPNHLRAFQDNIARKAFRTEYCMSWDAGDDADFQFTRK